MQLLNRGTPFPRKEGADFFAAIIRRLILVGAAGVLVASIPIALLWEQNLLIERQNEAILDQNEKIQIQLQQQANANKRQEEDTRVVRRAQLLTLIYERTDCDLNEELKKHQQKSEAAERRLEEAQSTIDSDILRQIRETAAIKTRNTELCPLKAPLRLRQEAVLALAQIDNNDLSLVGAELSGVDLSGANLSGADLSRTVLAGAVLSGAILHGSNLVEADLRNADLESANLSEAQLNRANLARISHQATETDSRDHSGRRSDAQRVPLDLGFDPDRSFPRFFSPAIAN